MFGRKQVIVCANPECQEQQIPARELLFLCPRRKLCKGFARRDHLNPEVKAAWPDDSLFVPKRYRYSVSCPYDGQTSYLKVCPYCGEKQPVATGNLTTIAVIGASASGKTCFIAGLIKRVMDDLVKRARLRAAVEWDDDEGRLFYESVSKTIYINKRLPQKTQVQTKVKTIQITVRVPMHGWRAIMGRVLLKLSGYRWGDTSHTVSLVFPDPAGEPLEKLDEAYYIEYLAQAKAIILMVDPFASDKYRDRLEEQGLPIREKKGVDPAHVLNVVARRIKQSLGKQKGVLKQEVAVVLTKCDEPGILDPAAPEYRQPKQGRKYNLRTARRLSDKVREFIEDDLGMAGIAAAAEQNFRRQCFFAVSPLGRPPVKTGETSDGDPIIELIDPAPRFTEDPFLWILKQWKYI